MHADKRTKQRERHARSAAKPASTARNARMRAERPRPQQKLGSLGCMHRPSDTNIELPQKPPQTNFRLHTTDVLSAPAAATAVRASSVLARENSRIMEFISRSGRYFPHWSRPARGVSVTDL